MSSLLKMPVEYISEELFEDFKNTLKVKRLLAQKLNCSIQKLRQYETKIKLQNIVR